MAKFNFREHKGLTAGEANAVKQNVYELVKQAAEGVSWNVLGTAPAGFTMTNIAGHMKPIHTKTEIAFKAGFLMREVQGNQQWEGHAIVGGLRLDLQSINNGWANWAIQTNGTNSKTVATCLMSVNRSFSQRQLAKGLIYSAERNEICELL